MQIGRSVISFTVKQVVDSPAELLESTTQQAIQSIRAQQQRPNTNLNQLATRSPPRFLESVGLP